MSHEQQNINNKASNQGAQGEFHSEVHTGPHIDQSGQLVGDNQYNANRDIYIYNSASAEKPISTRDIPPLLPYLADRDDQEKELREILRTCSQSSEYPIIFVVHGDDRQCHDMFLQRLKDVTLRKYMGLDETTSIPAYEMPWPSRLHDPSQLASRLRMSLADEMSLHSHHDISSADINEILAVYPGPVLIHTHLLTDDFRHFGREALISYLRFWNDWPELIPGQQLFVFLFIKYQSPQKQSVIQRLTRPCVRQKHNYMIMRHLQEASWTEFNRIICRVIPKLENITRSDVEKWARMDETSRFCRGQNVFAEIRDLFENHPPDGISMDPLDQHLIAILRKFAAGEGH
jgi:hypothetical protein